jgi:hypothetical protein
LAYEVAMKLLESVRDARIRDSHLRDQAMRAARAWCSTRRKLRGASRAPIRHAPTIARGEACEAAAAVEIAVAAGEGDAAMLDAVLGHADRFVALATGFIR